VAGGRRIDERKADTADRADGKVFWMVNRGEEPGDVPRRVTPWLASVGAYWAAVVLAACIAGSPSVAPTVPPQSAHPSPTATDFRLDVMPAMSIGRTIGGQRVTFLVTVTGDRGDGPVGLTVVADDAAISIEPQPLPPGVVGEVSVTPDPVVTEADLAVTITASRAGIERQERRTLHVTPGEDTLLAEATTHLSQFTGWLMDEQPQLGIGPGTVWEGTPGSWVLVVNHYLFFSEDWEIGLAWHVMIPPDDWSMIYLRHRWTEAHPSLAFEIPSVAGAMEPREIDPPDDVWR
jgi:hypothetical protein